MDFVDRLEKLTAQYRKGLLTWEDLIVLTREVLDNEEKRIENHDR